MNTDRKTTSTESRNRITGAKLIRWSGLAALVAGTIFAVIQPIHPPDFLSSVTGSAWATIMPFKLVMCLLFLLGITGLYARQVEKAGWLGLAGYLMLMLSWALQTAYIFSETFVLPVLATAAPQFVESFLGIANGVPGEMNIGAIPAVYSLLGLMYILGGLLFGIATFRAGILPRWAAGLLAVTATVTPAAAMLPHEIQRLVGMPVGIALAWMGYALWSERRAKAAERLPDMGSPQLRQSVAE